MNTNPQTWLDNHIAEIVAKNKKIFSEYELARDYLRIYFVSPNRKIQYDTIQNAVSGFSGEGAIVVFVEGTWKNGGFTNTAINCNLIDDNLEETGIEVNGWMLRLKKVDNSEFPANCGMHFSISDPLGHTKTNYQQYIGIGSLTTTLSIAKKYAHFPSLEAYQQHVALNKLESKLTHEEIHRKELERRLLFYRIKHELTKELLEEILTIRNSQSKQGQKDVLYVLAGYGYEKLGKTTLVKHIYNTLKDSSDIYSRKNPIENIEVTIDNFFEYNVNKFLKYGFFSINERNELPE